MMRALTLTEITTATRGTLMGPDLRVPSVSTDTRSLKAGDLFVALQGERFDGNALVGKAREAGAAAAVISRDDGADLPKILVEDTAEALGDLAALNRRLSSAVVLAITGSQGKTTVKEMLASILRCCGETLVTRANLNNTVGVPLTLLQLAPEHRYAVIEMGANRPGEIAFSVSSASPDIAHITNVAATHLEGFGSLAGVSQAKSEIWHGIDEGGTAVINLDDAFSGHWLEANKGRRVVTISAAGEASADYSLTDITLQPGRASTAVLNTPQGQVGITLDLPGRHNLANALAAAALACEAGAGIQQVRDGLAAMQPVSGRMTSCDGREGSRVIDDSYNASPASFRAAIDVLSACPGESILVMGDMGELGGSVIEAHRVVGQYAAEQGVARLLATGHFSEQAVEAFGPGAQHFDSQDALLGSLLPLLNENVTVLVKGSRSARMDKLIAPLTRGEN